MSFMIPQTGPLVVYVNGYGAPSKPLKNEGLTRYFTRMLLVLGPHLERVSKIFLCGGFTNRLDMSEARAMQIWIDRYWPEVSDRAELIQSTTTVRENVDTFSGLAPSGHHPIFFCEYSRRWSVSYHAQRHFREFTMMGVGFDPPSLRYTHQLKQLVFHLPLEIVSVHSAWVDRWRAKVRQQHIAKARAAFLADE